MKKVHEYFRTAILALAGFALLLPSVAFAAQKSGDTWQAGFGYVQSKQERDCQMSGQGYRYQAGYGYIPDKQEKEKSSASREHGLRYKAGFGYVRE